MKIDRRFERAVECDLITRERTEKQQIATEIRSIIRKLDIETARKVLGFARDRGRSYNVKH
jgi:hypothetical protein